MCNTRNNDNVCRGGKREKNSCHIVKKKISNSNKRVNNISKYMISCFIIFIIFVLYVAPPIFFLMIVSFSTAAYLA